MTEPEKSIREKDVRLNDNLIRWIGIPFLGIVIPNVSGLFGDLSFTEPTYWFGYPYFIGLAFAIWQGNRYLLFRTRSRFTWFDRPIEKLILLFVNNLFYTTPLTIAWLCLWYQWGGFTWIHWDVILVVSLINVICVLFITHVYETVFMVKEQQNEQTRNAELERSKAQAELEALKNQIDPHFMFNSLNSLSYLITKDSSRALQFTENLAEIYRYILSQKEQSLVLLEDELAFMTKYTNLLELRFGKALSVKKDFNGATEQQYLILPISAFVAMENVVKHNEITEKHPLEVTLEMSDGLLIIRNPIREKQSIRHSSKIGLQNLDERFRILTGKGIESEKTRKYFSVKLPLIHLEK